jgi:Fic family protein
MLKISENYPHLAFENNWKITQRGYIHLGQIIGYFKSISNTPIMPSYYDELMTMSLIRGAQATTAIEGNTLTDEEISKLKGGQKLPPSKKYQEIEVRNILEAFNSVLKETVYQNKEQLISEELLLNFHRMVGKDLGEHFEAVPGRYRQNNVIVGGYRPPDYADVPNLMKEFCKWLREEFKFEQGQQLPSEVLIQAIVSHVYLEWVHPFGDGNGRTGRLLEYYILARAGFPDITLHILSNHYNLTRPEYYRQLDRAAKTQSLTDFIQYAFVGLRDGLQQTLETIQESQLHNTWQKFVYETFGDIEMSHKEVFKRRRRLALEIPIHERFTMTQIPELNIKLAKMYSGISSRTLERDVRELLDNKLLIQEGKDYYANIDVLNKMKAKSKNRVRYM